MYVAFPMRLHKLLFVSNDSSLEKHQKRISKADLWKHLIILKLLTD